MHSSTQKWLKLFNVYYVGNAASAMNKFFVSYKWENQDC